MATQSTVPRKIETVLGTGGITGVGSEGVHYLGYASCCDFATLLPYYYFLNLVCQTIDNILPNATISISGYQFLDSPYDWCSFGVCLRNGVLLDASHCLSQVEIPSNKFNSKLGHKICFGFSCDCVLYHKYPLNTVYRYPCVTYVCPVQIS